MSSQYRMRHSISGLFVFLMLGLFALLSTVMVLLGARAYRNIVQAQAQHNTERIAPAYIRSMVRSADETGTLRIEHGEESDVLVIEQTFDDEQVITYIYCHEGMLRERFMTADLDFNPEDGEEVCPLNILKLDMRDSLLHVQLNDHSQTTEMNIALHTAM